MNNRGKIFTLSLIIILIFGYFFGQEREVVKENNKVIKIGVLQLLSHTALDTIYKGLEDELSNLGYKVGDNIQIDLQNAQGDQSNLVSMSDKLVSEKNDILVAITTPSALSLSNATKEIPIVMAGITYPVEAGLIKSEQLPGNNITGVSDRTPLKEQLDIMKQILPNIKKIGIIYTASEDNSVKQANDMKKLAEELNIEVISKTVSNTNDIQQVAESVASNVDCIFIPIDNTLASAMPTLINVTDKYKIPVFPSSDSMVIDGGLLALGVDQYKIGVETAKVLVALLNGEKAETKPIVIANDGIIYLNEEKAKQLNIKIPENIKEKAQIVK